MPWKTKVAIGGFKSGEIVPAEKAEIWDKMYTVSPVQFVSEPVIDIPKEQVPEKKAEAPVVKHILK